LDTLRPNLVRLAQRARFRVVMSGVIGSAPPQEVLEVVEFAQSHGLSPRILLLHDEHGQIGLTPDELAVFERAKRRLGRHAKEAHNYRDRLIRDGMAPFHCRSGARYLYVDELGMVRWCAQTRASFGKDLLEYTADDLREHFYTEKSCSDRCAVG